MADIVYVKDKETGKVDAYTPANARDLTNHRSDRFTIVSAKEAKVPGATEKANDGYDLGVVADRNGRVGPRTQHNLTDGVSSQTLVDEATKNGEGPDGPEDDEENEVAPNLGNGVVRSTSGELVDDALVDALKALNKQQLVAYGKSEFDLDLDGRKSEDNLRLAIYDAAEEANEG